MGSDSEDLMPKILCSIGDVTFFKCSKMGNFYEVYRALKELGLSIPTMRENVELIAKVCTNVDSTNRSEVLRSEQLEYRANDALLANTGIHYTENGVYFQDNPAFDENNRVTMDESKLEEILNKEGKREEDGVTFSADGTVRFVEYGFKVGDLPLNEIRTNKFIIGLTGSVSAAEKLATIAEKYGDGMNLLAYESSTNFGTRPAEISIGGDWHGERLILSTVHSEPHGCAYGVK